MLCTRDRKLGGVDPLFLRRIAVSEARMHSFVLRHRGFVSADSQAFTRDRGLGGADPQFAKLLVCRGPIYTSIYIYYF